MPFFRSATKRRTFILFLMIAVSIYAGLYSFYFVETKLRPNLTKIAETRTKKIVTEAINDAVSKRIAEETDYNKLLDVKLDSQGRVSYAQLNFSEVTRIAAQTTIRVQNTLKAIEKEIIRIPLGMVFDSAILSQYGPTIPITIVPQGSAYTNIDWSFEEAGINQTLHVVYVEVNAYALVIIPFDTKPVQITTKIPIAYALYIGNVPQFYYNGQGVPAGNENSGNSMVNPPNIFPPIQIQGTN